MKFENMTLDEVLPVSNGEQIELWINDNDTTFLMVPIGNDFFLTVAIDFVNLDAFKSGQLSVKEWMFREETFHNVYMVDKRHLGRPHPMIMLNGFDTDTMAIMNTKAIKVEQVPKVTSDNAIQLALKLEQAGSFLTEPDEVALSTLLRIFDMENPEHRAFYDAISNLSKARAEVKATLEKYST